jgi:hypothetical protein
MDVVLRRFGQGAALLIGRAAYSSAALARVPDCEGMAAQTGARFGLPEGLLPAISRVETGLKQGERGVRGWPWTLNVQGKGYYFKTREEALAKLRAVLDAGVRNVDVGCMQINYRWHAENFASVEEMMSPEANTAYAAKFLTRLKNRHGSWEVATKYYHSSDRTRGTAYLGRVHRVLARLPQVQPSFVASTAAGATGAQVAGGGQGRGRHSQDSVLVSLPKTPTAWMGARRSVVLPDSPRPELTVLQTSARKTKRQNRYSRASSARQDLVQHLRREFAR